MRCSLRLTTYPRTQSDWRNFVSSSNPIVGFHKFSPKADQLEKKVFKSDVNKYWKSVYNWCASLIYTMWLKYNIVEISRDLLRFHKIFWDLRRSSDISHDLLMWQNTYDILTFELLLLPFGIYSHKICWDLTRSTEIYRDLTRSTEI